MTVTSIECLFIDFQQAFDSVWRGNMLGAMEGFGKEPGVVEVVRSMYRGTKARVRKNKLVINVSKIKVMKISRREEEINLEIGGERVYVEHVNKFKYLGAYFTGEGGTGRAVLERIKARRLRKMLSSRQLTLKVMMRVFKTMVIPKSPL